MPVTRLPLTAHRCPRTFLKCATVFGRRGSFGDVRTRTNGALAAGVVAQMFGDVRTRTKGGAGFIVPGAEAGHRGDGTDARYGGAPPVEGVVVVVNGRSKAAPTEPPRLSAREEGKPRRLVVISPLVRELTRCLRCVRRRTS